MIISACAAKHLCGMQGMPILTQGRHKCSMCKHDMHGAAFCGQNYSDIILCLAGEAGMANPSSSATICNLCYVANIKDEF